MRILELINTLEPGGAEQMVSSLSLALTASNHAVHLVCLRDAGFMPVPEEQLRAGGVHFAAFNKGDGFSMGAVRQLAAYVRKHEIEVIHTHNPLVNHYGIAAARFAQGVAVINTLHGTATLEMGGPAKGLFWASCLMTDRVVAVCDAVREELLRRYRLPSRKIGVVYNGIDQNSLLRVVRGPADGRVTFGTMARMVPVKDLSSMLTAFSLVHAKYPNTRLEILGEGELRSSLEKTTAELGIRADVAFHGWSSDIAAFLSNIDCFVISSRNEGLPLTLLEAMAASLPIVATRVGGVPEIVESAGCGWLCPAQQPEALAGAMEAALNATDLKEKGMRARKVARSRYSVEQMASDYAGIFKELIHKRSSERGGRFDTCPPDEN